MQHELSKYNCSEYLNEFYSNGMFHPTEAYELFNHREMIQDEENHHLQIGGIWDDMDSKICYRESKEGVWGRYNYDGTYYLLSETLKEFVEGWYQWNSNYWGSMPTEIQWIEIGIFYKTNIDRYNWKTHELMEFVIQAIENQILTKFFIKAHEKSFSVSSINGFTRRPNNNMVVIQYDSKQEEYCAYYKESFFKDNFSKSFKKDQIVKGMESIKEWVEKGNRV